MAEIKHKNKTIPVNDNNSITEACEQLGVLFSCYEGICGICEIKILEGKENLSELTENEKMFGLDGNKRLACQCRIKKGMVKIEF